MEYFVGCGECGRLDESEDEREKDCEEDCEEDYDDESDDESDDEREYASVLERWRALRGRLIQVGDDEWEERETSAEEESDECWSDDGWDEGETSGEDDRYRWWSDDENDDESYHFVRRKDESSVGGENGDGDAGAGKETCDVIADAGDIVIEDLEADGVVDEEVEDCVVAEEDGMEGVGGVEGMEGVKGVEGMEGGENESTPGENESTPAEARRRVSIRERIGRVWRRLFKRHIIAAV